MVPLARVQKAIASYPDLKIVLFDSSTHTAELAAQTLGVAVGQIAKTLVFQADDAPVLVVAAGDKKVDNKRLARAIPARKARFATAEVVSDYTGFPPGGVSPLGLLREMPVYLDQSLWDYDIVYAAAGTANSALPVKPDRLREITGAKVIDVCK